ncbi:MAG: VWA domain-containing protein [Lachnospiraceae bacterium]|nr:VWA domain-containing protein [Lachnospiraceae bacterium]
MIIGLVATRNIGRSTYEVDREKALSQLEKMVAEIQPGTKEPTKAIVTSADRANVARELPDISTCEVVVQPTTSNYIEIYSSPEKAGSGQDGWLTQMGEEFNRSGGVTINGVQYSVLIRKVNSGEAVDYISSGKAVPDAFTPSSDMWKLMLEADGVSTEVISESMVNNQAGLCVANDVYKTLESSHGNVDMKTITDATAMGELTTGYTNPFASSSGLNLLVSILNEYGNGDIYSDAAKNGFNEFQMNVPYVALTTMQLRESAEKGTFDAFVCEYQTYINDSALSRSYKFVPYGYLHNNPLISVTKDGDKTQALKAFSDYCSSDSAKNSASQYGFNNNSDYKCNYGALTGEQLREAQTFYKENKNSSPVICVFVTDVSGSMLGAPLSELQNSLINAMQYINSNNYVGLVSYADNVNIELPIKEFDAEQQSYFKGAVQGLRASGGTATFNGVCVALDMIEKQLEKTPDATPIIFVLSDGATNTGYKLSDIEGVTKSLKVPIYTIGYNADIDALQKISDINEAACINADTDDIMYQMKMLFNSSL